MYVWVCIKKKRYKLPYNSAIPSLGIYIQEKCVHMSTKRHMFKNVHSNFIHYRQNWKHPKCSSTGEWINKLWCILTMEYHTAIYFFKKSKMLINATKMNLKNIILWESCQIQESTHCTILFI